jgi:enamine deaminase RidA (YjgF/YER057c/UK114 family)
MSRIIRADLATDTALLMPAYVNATSQDLYDIFNNGPIVLVKSMIAERLSSHGIDLSTKPVPIGSYSSVIIASNFAYVSGQIATDPNKQPAEVKFKGKVGKDVSINEAKKAAELCVINGLSQLNAALGDLERVKKFVKLSGYINCEPTFIDHATVMNGASDFLVRIFEDRGKHARIAVGVNSLPLNSCVEIDLIVEI